MVDKNIKQIFINETVAEKCKKQDKTLPYRVNDNRIKLALHGHNIAIISTTRSHGSNSNETMKNQYTKILQLFHVVI